MERNYQEGKIYKLFVPGLEEYCYIGSTTNTLTERLCQHRFSAYCKSQTKTAACAMFIDQETEPIIELVEAFPCNSKLELETRERYWIEKYPDCINSNTPTRTWKERWEANRDRNLTKHKEWLINNADKVAKHREKARAKQVENAKAKRHAMTEEEKAAFNEKKRQARAELVTCSVCNAQITKGQKWRHDKTHK